VTWLLTKPAILEELSRLEIQDNMITTGMGGVLPELSDKHHLRRVLDVGCGTGGWLMELARTHPTREKLVGGDISHTMMEYARSQAVREGLDGRVQFQEMDALRALPFPDSFFDLVNQRLGVSWMRNWEWKKLFVEYHRVTRPGGIIRMTEAAIVQSNSEALTRLCDLVLETCFHSARFFDQRPDGIISKLVPLMTMHGSEDVQTQGHSLAYHTGTREHVMFSEDMRHLFRVSLPFFQKWAHVPDDYEDIYQRALIEMQQPKCVAHWQFLTAWGIRPTTNTSLLMRGLN